jgi:hypothetical protein
VVWLRRSRPPELPDLSPRCNLHGTTPDPAAGHSPPSYCARRRPLSLALKLPTLRDLSRLEVSTRPPRGSVGLCPEIVALGPQLDRSKWGSAMPSTEAARWRWASSYPPPMCVMGWKYETGSTLWTRSPCPAHTGLSDQSPRDPRGGALCLLAATRKGRRMGVRRDNGGGGGAPVNGTSSKLLDGSGVLPMNGSKESHGDRGGLVATSPGPGVWRKRISGTGEAKVASNTDESGQGARDRPALQRRASMRTTSMTMGALNKRGSIHDVAPHPASETSWPCCLALLRIDVMGTSRRCSHPPPPACRQGLLRPSSQWAPPRRRS